MTSSPVCLAHFFDNLSDPRREHQRLHSLMDIITLTLCAVISGADTWVDIEQYGHKKKDWLRTFLELPIDIPSHDTIGRFFSLVDPVAFQECFLSWARSAAETTQGRLIAIDGKTVRRSGDKPSGKSALHLVSAWAGENNLILGQRAVDTKSNEITAMPELLKILDLNGALVTIDAMGCQKEIASQIRVQGGDYLLALKDNQPTLLEQTADMFQKGLDTDFADQKHRSWTTKEKGHGRVEYREYHVVELPKAMKERFSNWKDLRTLGMVLSIRQVGNEEPRGEFRYFIISLPLGVKKFAQGVRGHWAIENGLHWTLDVGFDEDESRVRKGNVPENFSWIRRMALTLLKNESTAKGGPVRNLVSVGSNCVDSLFQSL